MAEILPIMSKTFFWTEGFDNHMWAIIFTHTVNTLASLFSTFYPMVRGIMAVNKNLEHLAGLAAASAEKARASMDEVIMMHSEPYGSSENAKIEKAEAKWMRSAKNSKAMGNMVKLAKLGFTDIILGQVGTGISRAFGTSNQHINFHGKHPGHERSQESNKLNMEASIRSSCMRARESLRAGSETLFSGAMTEPDG